MHCSSDIGGATHVGLEKVAPTAALGVFSNVSEDISIPKNTSSSFESDASAELGLGRNKIGKKHRITKNNLSYFSNFGCERGMADWGHVAATMLVGKVRGRNYSAARL